jgi:hypothetical protein
MMQDIVRGAWLVSKYTSKASVLFLRPLDYIGKRGTQPGKLSTLHLGRVLIYSLATKSHAFQLAASPACTPSAVLAALG